MGTLFVVVGVVGVLLAIATRFGDPPGWKKTVGTLGGVCALVSIIGACYIRARSEADKNAKIQAVEARAARRKISSWSRERLLAILRANPGSVKIGCTLFGDEPRDYALQLYDLFKEAGWKTDWCTVQYSSPPPLEITCNTDETKAAILAKAFVVAHIPYFPPRIIDPQRDPCEIRVGSRLPELDKWFEQHQALGSD